MDQLTILPESLSSYLVAADSLYKSIQAIGVFTGETDLLENVVPVAGVDIESCSLSQSLLRNGNTNGFIRDPVIQAVSRNAFSPFTVDFKNVATTYLGAGGDCLTLPYKYGYKTFSLGNYHKKLNNQTADITEAYIELDDRVDETFYTHVSHIDEFITPVYDANQKLRLACADPSITLLLLEEILNTTAEKHPNPLTGDGAFKRQFPSQGTYDYTLEEDEGIFREDRLAALYDKLNELEPHELDEMKDAITSCFQAQDHVFIDLPNLANPNFSNPVNLATIPGKGTVLMGSQNTFLMKKEDIKAIKPLDIQEGAFQRLNELGFVYSKPDESTYEWYDIFDCYLIQQMLNVNLQAFLVPTLEMNMIGGGVHCSTNNLFSNAFIKNIKTMVEDGHEFNIYNNYYREQYEIDRYIVEQPFVY